MNVGVLPMVKKGGFYLSAVAMLDYWRVVLIEKTFPANKVQCSGFAGYGLKPILFDRIFFSGEDLKRSSNLATILR